MTDEVLVSPEDLMSKTSTWFVAVRGERVASNLTKIAAMDLAWDLVRMLEAGCDCTLWIDDFKRRSVTT